ncbi:unnamed protein product [Brassicogethes aeneus]|uniref:Uncharacterized protein n=1 Tax=Brassicogethes aeneus TaxID=1431903 RepID=A0A9P0FF16_BRAAE|nr:unnamed protein product [Brassicogethes aeneus]
MLMWPQASKKCIIIIIIIICVDNNNEKHAGEEAEEKKRTNGRFYEMREKTIQIRYESARHGAAVVVVGEAAAVTEVSTCEWKRFSPTVRVPVGLVAKAGQVPPRNGGTTAEEKASIPTTTWKICEKAFDLRVLTQELKPNDHLRRNFANCSLQQLEDFKRNNEQCFQVVQRPWIIGVD